MKLHIKRIVRYLIITAAMVVYSALIIYLFGPIIDQFVLDGIGIVNESAMFSFVMCVQTSAAVIM